MLLPPRVARAQTATWTGAVSTLWSNRNNWSGLGGAPLAGGENLIFPGAAANLATSNNMAAGMTFASITFSASGYTLAGNAIVIGAGNVTDNSASGTNTISLAMAFAATRTVLVTNAATTTVVSGIISGAGGLTKTGAGTLTLSGANTYSGATTVSAGVLDVQHNSALGTTAGATTVASGAALQVDGSGLVIAEPLTLAGTGVAAGGALRNLANSNSWTGAITLGAAARINSDAGTLTVSNTISGATIALTVGGAGNTTIGGVLGTTSGTLTKTGAGTLTLSGANTYSGATTVSAGVLDVQHNSALGTTAGATTVASGAALQVDGSGLVIAEPLTLAGTGVAAAGALRNLANSNSWTGAITLGAGGARINSDAGTLTVSAIGGATQPLTVGGVGNTTVSGVLGTTTGTLTKMGAGTLTLSGTNTYSGATTINAGTVAIAADAGLGTAPGVATAGQLTFGGGTLQTTASFTLNANRGIALTGAGTLSTDPTTMLTYGGIIAGASTLTKTGTGTLTLSGANSYAGITTVSAGVLDVQHNSALGTTAGATTVASGAALQVDGSGLVIAEPLTLAGTGVAAGGALRNLANSNSWTGAITLGATGARINSDAGTLTVAAIGGATQPLTVGGVGNTTVSGVLGTTTGTLTKDGAGTLTLSGANTYSGATTISGGRITIAADNNLGTAPASATPGQLTINGGTLASTATFTLGVNRGVAINSGGATLDVAAATTLTYAGIIAGANGLTKTSSGTLSLGSATLTVSSFSISAGTVLAPSVNSFAVSADWSNSGTFTANGGTVTLNGGTGQLVTGSSRTTFNNLTLNNASGVTLGTSATVNGTMTFTSGNVATSGNTLIIGPSGSVTQTSGFVVGNLRKQITTNGSVSRTFEVGTGSTYSPVTVVLTGVAGSASDSSQYLTVSSTAGDHPSVTSSGINSAKSVNRYWTIARGGSWTTTSFSPTFTFVAGDVDAGGTPTNFAIRRFSGAAWSVTTAGTMTATTSQATGVTAFGDFAVGEATTTATSVATSGTPAAFGVSVTFTATVTQTGGAATPVGTVTFRDGGTDCATGSVIQGAQTVNGSGVVAAITAALSQGSHTVRACYDNSSTSLFPASSGTVSQVINNSYTVSVTPSTTSANQLPSNGTNYTIIFTVQNNGLVIDDVDLLISHLPGPTITTVSLTGTGVTQGSNKDSARVAGVVAGGSVSVTVTYSIGSAAAGTTDTLVLQARSVGNPAQTASGRLTATVVRPSVVAAKTLSPAGTQPIGTQVAFADTVTNTGSGSASTVILVDSLSTSLHYKVGSATTTFPVAVAVEYSNNAGATWTYSPVSGGCGGTSGYDACVNRVRVRLLAPLSAVPPNNTGYLTYIALIR